MPGQEPDQLQELMRQKAAFADAGGIGPGNPSANQPVPAGIGPASAGAQIQPQGGGTIAQILGLLQSAGASGGQFLQDLLGGGGAPPPQVDPAEAAVQAEQEKLRR